MNEYIDIRVPSNPKIMRLVRKTISSACEMVGFEPKEVNAITLAVDEGCTNIIRHCYKGKAEETIVIRLRLFKDKLVIVLKDFGEGIDLKKLEASRKKKQQDVQQQNPIKPGGLGVLLIHAVMDKVQYKTSPRSGTVLRLTKYISKTQED